MSAVRFDGFGDAVVDFFEGLEADNSKVYWQRNLALYTEHVRQPMEALVAELEPAFAGAASGGDARAAGKVFRPRRDVRFTRDKSPYKTHCGAVIEAGRGAGAFYVEVSADGLLVAGGCFHTGPDQLARYRAAVDDDLRGEQLRRVLAGLPAEWTVAGETLRTRPRGQPAGHPRIDLLRHRTLYASRRWEPDETLHERSCLERVGAAWGQVRDLAAWCADHVGIRRGSP